MSEIGKINQVSNVLRTNQLSGTKKTETTKNNVPIEKVAKTNDQTPVDIEKVNRLKNEISNGTYKVDSLKIAKSILEQI